MISWLLNLGKGLFLLSIEDRIYSAMHHDEKQSWDYPLCRVSRLDLDVEEQVMPHEGTQVKLLTQHQHSP